MAQAGPDVTKIAEALRGAASAGVRNLNYRLAGDTVEITGEADTIAAKQQAFKAVTSAVGDTGVKNAITIRQAAAAPAAAPAAAAPAAAAPAAASPSAAGFTPVSQVTTPAAGGGDANAILEAKAREHGEKLDWKHSVVDLMKLLGMDSSIGARKALAAKLGYTGDAGDSAKVNMWLHEELMKKVSAGGGSVPKDLLA